MTFHLYLFAREVSEHTPIHTTAYSFNSGTSIIELARMRSDKLNHPLDVELQRFTAWLDLNDFREFCIDLYVENDGVTTIFENFQRFLRITDGLTDLVDTMCRKEIVNGYREIIKHDKSDFITTVSNIANRSGFYRKLTTEGAKLEIGTPRLDFTDPKKFKIVLNIHVSGENTYDAIARAHKRHLETIDLII